MAFNPTIAGMALEATGTADFEQFCQAMLLEVLGEKFEPTGGIHDGGQDGFLRPLAGKPSEYVQISKQATSKAKILSTIERLRQSGREVRSLTYVTHLEMPTRDVLEALVQKETGVAVRIIDRRWICLQVDLHESLESIFLDRFATAVRSAEKLLGHTPRTFEAAERMSLLAYLETHSRSEPQNAEVMDLAIDAAIFMSLKDTDPDEGKFKTEPEVVEFIEAFYPSIKGQASSVVSGRLDRLSTKKSNPRLGKHAGGRYCLPYDVRSEFGIESAILRGQEASFVMSVRKRIHDADPGLTDVEVGNALEAVAQAIYQTFENQSLILSAMATEEPVPEVPVFAIVESSVKQIAIAEERKDAIHDSALNVLRQIFYAGNEQEREYLVRLAKMYCLDFVLRGDSAVVKYFSNMFKQLKLYVGADIIVRALSETCIAPSSRATCNTLDLLKRAGARLFLTQRVLEEVHGHIHATDREFENFYAPWEARATVDATKNADRILIRAYFYAKLEPTRHERSPQNWRQYLDWIGGARNFDSDAGRENIASYLMGRFGFEFITAAEMDTLCHPSVVTPLARKFDASRKDFRLAYNDACMLLYVREARKREGEVYTDNIYGYNSWWLTEEFATIRLAKEAGIHERIKMHPQFLASIILVSPKLHSVATNSPLAFPLSFGLKITRRVPRDVLESFLNRATAAMAGDEALQNSAIRSAINDLKALGP